MKTKKRQTWQKDGFKRPLTSLQRRRSGGEDALQLKRAKIYAGLIKRCGSTEELYGRHLGPFLCFWNLNPKALLLVPESDVEWMVPASHIYRKDEVTPLDAMRQRSWLKDAPMHEIDATPVQARPFSDEAMTEYLGALND